MSTAAQRRRPITRRDLEQKFGEVRDATSESGAGPTKGMGVAVGVVAVVAVVAVAYFLGNRRGRKRRTIVEVKRVR